VTQLDVLQHVLGTTPLSTTQWIVSIAAAARLLVAWEIGKAITRAVAKPKAPETEAATA
jgi:hypothetical protein